MRLAGLVLTKGIYGGVVGVVMDSGPILHSPVDPEWDGKYRRVYDANGTEIENLLRCNLATGECIQYATNKGVIITHFNERGEEEALQMRQMHKAPLRAEVVDG